ncbi:MAG: MFS transporter [Methanocellales archaeon]
MKNKSGIEKSALIAVTLSSFLTPFAVSSVNVALPTIGREFAMDAISLNWVATAYLLTSAIFLVPIGRLADIKGRKKLFILGTFIFTITSFFLAISNSGAMVILLRAIQGMGGAMIFGTGVAILTSIFPVGERGKMLGINVAAVYIGLSTGPFIGGFFTQQLGWRSIFYLNIPLGFLIIAFSALRLKGEWAEAKGEEFDLAGSMIYCFMLLSIMYGFSLLPAISGAWLILMGALGMLFFILWEMRVKNPVLNLNLFRDNTVFAFSNLAALINYSATFAVSFLLSLYLQYIKGLNPQDAGVILVSQPAVQAIFSPLAGRLSDKIEPRIVASSGMALTAIGLFLFTFLSKETALEYIIASLILLGFGFALFSSPNTNAVMSSVDKRFYGIASATLGTMRLTGQMLSMGIAMLIFAIYIGKVEINPAIYPNLMRSTQVAFGIFSALCFAGIFASLARGKLREK